MFWKTKKMPEPAPEPCKWALSDGGPIGDRLIIYTDDTETRAVAIAEKTILTRFFGEWPRCRTSGEPLHLFIRSIEKDVQVILSCPVHSDRAYDGVLPW